MAESETTDESPRGAARRARRQRLRRIATSVASVVMLALIVGIVLVVTGAVELPGAGTSAQASDRPPDSTTTSTTHAKAQSAASRRRTPREASSAGVATRSFVRRTARYHRALPFRSPRRLTT